MMEREPYRNTDTPKYREWVAAETKAARAEMRLRQAGRQPSRTGAAAPGMAARVQQLKEHAASLFGEAMAEMHSAVDVALDRAQARDDRDGAD